MKIVLINHSDCRGGASVVTRRLMHALRNLGHDATMLVVHKGTDDPHVFLAAPRWRSRLPFYAEHLRIFCACRFSRENLFKISIATDGLPLSTHPLVRGADAVILNWVNQGMLSLAEIARIAADKKLLWTMHDMWNLTSLCHHAGACRLFTEDPGCSACPLAPGSAISARTWRRKKRLYTGAPMRFVAVSSWLARKCARSSLLGAVDVPVIHNAFPVEDFYISPRKTRQELHLPAGRKIILMGAARLDDSVKGLPYAVDVLNSLRSTDAIAVFYGAVRDGSALTSLRFPHVMLGTVDGETVRELCAHASVVISTSLYETLPGTLIEGMAAGCTPVAFDSGGQSDIIRENGRDGWLIRPYDIAAFARAVDKALEEPCDSAYLRKVTAERFSAEAVARRYVELLSRK